MMLYGMSMMSATLARVVDKRIHSSAKACLLYKLQHVGNSRYLSSRTASVEPAATQRNTSAHDTGSRTAIESHPDLRLDELKDKRFITQDFLSSKSSDLLEAALEGHMPKRSRHAQRHWMQLGHHQVYFRPRLTPSQLLFDGTDTKFLPGDADIWKYRLWAGGSVTFNHSQPLSYNPTQEATQIEFVQDVRVTGTEVLEKVFVKIKKAISPTDMLMGEISEQSTEQLLKRQPLLEESYTLCFLREPITATPDRPAIRPPKKPMFSHTMTPDHNLLFQFSALTHNAHKIHFDKHFANQEYGLRGCVVHGPFTQVLMIDFLQRSLANLSQHQDGFDLIPMHMDYSNFRPLYAGEKMTICCSPAKSHTAEPLQAPTWQVWIQTGSGTDTSLAVRGTIRVSKIPGIT